MTSIPPPRGCHHPCRLAAALALALPVVLVGDPAQAHPHVWITADVTFAAPENRLHEIRHT